jgi:acyl carrier protein
VKSELEHQIKELIIESLNLEDVAAADIQTDAPLFVEGLGLDSIDALELGLALQRRFGIQIGDSDAGREHFASVRSLAVFVAEHAPALKAGG